MNFMNSQQGKQHSIKYQRLSHHELHKPKPTRKISKVKELITMQATHHKLSKELHDELHELISTHKQTSINTTSNLRAAGKYSSWWKSVYAAMKSSLSNLPTETLASVRGRSRPLKRRSSECLLLGK
jgi:hypothetical protein